MRCHDDSKIFKKAGSLLARRDHSRWELRTKLIKAAPASQVDRLLDRLEQLNLLNDHNYAYNFALSRMHNSGWGPARVRSYLLARGVGKEIVDSVLEQACKEVDQQSMIIKYAQMGFVRMKSRIGLPEVRKMISHLRRRGFEEEMIHSALRQILSARLLNNLETGE